VYWELKALQLLQHRQAFSNNDDGDDEPKQLLPDRINYGEEHLRGDHPISINSIGTTGGGSSGSGKKEPNTNKKLRHLFKGQSRAVDKLEVKLSNMLSPFARSDGSPLVVALSGPSGVGKTELSRQVEERERE
jgi:hypothetical protein